MARRTLPPSSARALYGSAAPEELHFDSGGPIRIPARRRRVDGILLLHYEPRVGRSLSASTVGQHVASYARHSRFPVWEVNTAEPLTSALTRWDFAAIVLHYSLFEPTRYRINDGHRAILRSSNAYKIAFLQDEMRHCADRFWFCDEFEIDCIYTLLEPSEFAAVYGSRTRVREIRTNLPGYVDEGLTVAADRLRVPDADRPIDVGYRGRPLAPWMGRGALEKTEIGRRFAELVNGSGLVLDIGLDEEDRLYGEDWNRFIAHCRGMLGVESGVSAFDLDDRARHQYEQLQAERGPNAEITIDELERGALGDIDGNVYYRTVSPRHFEAAAFGVCQILFEGRYSGVLEADIHYLPLRKDFSNLDELVERFRDPAERTRIADAARRDLIDSGRYGYEPFVAGFDKTLMEAGLEPGDPVPRVWLTRHAVARRTHIDIRSRLHLAGRRVVAAVYGRLSRTRSGGALLRLLARARRARQSGPVT